MLAKTAAAIENADATANTSPADAAIACQRMVSDAECAAAAVGTRATHQGSSGAKAPTVAQLLQLKRSSRVMSESDPSIKCVPPSEGKGAAVVVNPRSATVAKSASIAKVAKSEAKATVAKSAARATAVKSAAGAGTSNISNAAVPVNLLSNAKLALPRRIAPKPNASSASGSVKESRSKTASARSGSPVTLLDLIRIKKKSTTPVIPFSKRCPECGQEFKSRAPFYRHQHVVHKIARNRIQCSQCDHAFPNMNRLCDHLRSAHQIETVTKKLQFADALLFRQWKEELERDTKSFYKCIRKSEYVSMRIRYFECHRSGQYKSKRKGAKIRELQSKGSKKIGKRCPARITVTEPKAADGAPISVTFCETHVGHGQDVEHLPSRVTGGTDRSTRLKRQENGALDQRRNALLEKLKALLDRCKSREELDCAASCADSMGAALEAVRTERQRKKDARQQQRQRPRKKLKQNENKFSNAALPVAAAQEFIAAVDEIQVALDLLHWGQGSYFQL